MLIQLTAKELKSLKADIRHGTNGRVAKEAGVSPQNLSKMLAGNYTKKGARMVKNTVLKAVKKVKADIDLENENLKQQYL